MKIEPLINVALTHEYNDKSNSSRLFNIESKIKSRAVLGGSLFPFIHTEANRYSIVGDKEELLDHLSTTPEGLNFEFRVHLTDPNFLYYTRSLLPDEQNDPDIQIRIIDNRLNLMSVIIHVTKELFKAGCPIEKNIHYQTKEAYWDFILIPRNPDYIYNPQIQISAESETKRSIFRKRDKTKRSKKESAQHSKSRNKSFVMTSVSAL